MKNVLLMAVLASLFGCAAQYQAASQNYRLKGETDALEIKGEFFKGSNPLTADDYVQVRFNGMDQIKVPVDRYYSGEANGLPFNGKPTSASCTGKKINRYNVEVRCMVFVDNEKTVTLTF